MKRYPAKATTRFVSALMVVVFALHGCASGPPPRAHFDEDVYGRYYETREGKILRVEQDGTILDVTCTEPTLARDFPREDVLKLFCAADRVTVLGKAKKSGREWDLSPYHVEPESGTCVSLFAPLSDSWTAEKRRSCANRFWEVPAATVAYPVMAAVVLGIVTAPIWLSVLILSKK